MALEKLNSKNIHTSKISKHLKHILSTTERESPTFLQIQDLHDSIIHQHRVPPRPHSQPNRLITQIKLTTNRLRESPIAIAEKHHIVADIEILLPRLHDEGIVDGDAGDGVNAFGFELRRLLDETWEVFLGASGGESAGDGEEDGLLVGGEVGDGDGLELVGVVEVGEGGVGELVADGDGGDFGGGGGEFEGCVAVTEFEVERERGGRGKEGFGGEERGGGGGGGEREGFGGGE
ncbi:hypothetical protein HYC85_021823 [Camellia sinensis]|uniref:Uncharacterized protein n=1 Tax=Camellia sinensis TaxID=4442 RepID=A0A7J7GMI5_CAMSI|nr:hypothetical protein HYC85_021823 [Camellia sinensis]